MTIFKQNQFKNELITTVFCDDFKRFIRLMKEDVVKQKIDDCIYVIDNLTETTILDCLDTLSKYQEQLVDYYKDKSFE